MIPYSRQSINSKDIESVKKTLQSDFLTQGPATLKFEKLISKLTRCKYVVSTNSASSALHIACLALGLKKNDIVWTVPNTFAASANCALNCGALLDFVDIDKDTFNISVTLLEKKLILAKKKKKLPKLLIPVHFAGQPSDQKKIWELAKKFKFKVIEDASHSIGAKHFGEPVGSCKWSNITIFSFHPVKIITTGEGGAALTKNKYLAQKMRMYATNGIVKNIENFHFKNKGPWYYEHQESGFNYRMNDISASLGITQIKRIKEFIKKRNSLANYYKKVLKNFPVNFQKIKSYNKSSYHLLIVNFDLKKTKFNYLSIFKKLRKNNIYVNLHYMPLHLSPYFKKKGFKKGQFPVAENYSDTSLSLPIFFDLRLKEINKICLLIKSFFKK